MERKELLCVVQAGTRLQALEEFSTRLCTSDTQLHLVLQLLAENLARMPDYYLPYACQCIVVSTIQFVSVTAFDRKTHSMALHKEATLFPEYRRTRSGIGEAFAFFIWDRKRFPDITAFVQAVP